MSVCWCVEAVRTWKARESQAACDTATRGQRPATHASAVAARGREGQSETKTDLGGGADRASEQGETRRPRDSEAEPRPQRGARGEEWRRIFCEQCDITAKTMYRCPKNTKRGSRLGICWNGSRSTLLIIRRIITQN
ncbi:hypothetical protein WA026_012009 [Henosepilachna vigintioctopunctata]|uniref:Uncharacterized protein n=1 Tax=Henosepilachna vigintioctopunctata TaxID=420089 RepID=A0AAW1V7J4_9CUCU